MRLPDIPEWWRHFPPRELPGEYPGPWRVESRRHCPRCAVPMRQWGATIGEAEGRQRFTCLPCWQATSSPDARRERNRERMAEVRARGDR